MPNASIIRRGERDSKFNEKNKYGKLKRRTRENAPWINYRVDCDV
jgi:hypothetical protein